MMRRYWGRKFGIGFGVALVVLTWVSPALARGKLDAFEADLVGERQGHKASSLDSTLFEEITSYDNYLLLRLCGITLGAGGIGSLQRVKAPELTDAIVEPRSLGDPLLPFARLDFVYQNVESDIDALDLRAEAGYGPIGAHFNITRYREQSPSDYVNLIRVLGLYRMSFGSHVETDIGCGSVTLRGEESMTQFLFSIPILIHPSDHWGMEFRPAWSTDLSDYDLAGLLTYRHASLKVGYRWVASRHESLNGPYGGVSVRW